MADRLSAHVATVLRHTPISLRALAKASGMSHALLSLIQSGERTATPEVARRLASSLRELSRTAGTLAARLERAADAAGKEG